MAKNKLQKFAELRKLTNTIQPDKSDLLNDRFCLKGFWKKEFKNNNPIILEVKGLDYTKEIFKSFYLSVNYSEQLEIFRSNLNKIMAFDLKKNFLPHISLAYGNHKINEKRGFISKITKLNKSIKVSKIGLVEINNDIKNWKILESFNLNYVSEL